MSSRLLDREESAQIAPLAWSSVDSLVKLRRAFAPRAPATAGPEKHDSHETRANVTAAEPPKDLERKLREAREQGFQEGQAAIREHAEAQVQAVLQRLTGSLASLADLRGVIRREAEQDLVKLAMAIARRIVRRELSVDPDSIQALVRVALEKLGPSESVRVRVHPQQQAAVRQYLDRYSLAATVELVADPSLQSGDLLFETTRGNLDASVDSQLREIERGFADRLQP
jgi:flagellar assembly protein FliH